MKTILTVIVICLVLLAANTSTVLAQLTIQPEIGYQWPLASEQLGLNTNTGGNYDDYGTYGQGLTAGIDVQYKFCSYLNLDFGCRYFSSAAINFVNMYTTDTAEFETDSRQNKFRMVVLSLGDVYDFGDNTSAFVPFIGVGLDCAVGGNLKTTDTYTSSFFPPSGNTIVTNSSTTTNAAIGCYGELGVKYHISSHFSLFGAFRFDALSITPSIMTINSYSVNGGPNIVSTMPLIARQTDYEKSFSSDYLPNQTSPNEESAYKIPASAWGFNIGVAYNFAAWTKTATTK
jgi:outer membrane protein W